MKQYRVIIEDNQTYDFTIELPHTLNEDEIDEAIWDYLAEHRDECWRSGEERIVACDDISDPSKRFGFVRNEAAGHPNRPERVPKELWNTYTLDEKAWVEIHDFIGRHLIPRR